MTNPLHPVYMAGMARSPILQQYALNVKVFETIKPDQWFIDYPQYTERLEAVMKLCEESGLVKAEPKTETIAEVFPPVEAPGGAPGGQMDVKQMITHMHAMMSQMMAAMQKDEQEKPPEENKPEQSAPAPAEKKPPLAFGK